MSRGLARATLVLAVAAAVAPAAAQSRRYPAPAIDPDDAAEHDSGFWGHVADPGRAQYEQQIREALLTVRGDRARAVALLRAATAARPELIEAWGYLGLVSDQVRDWAGCAEGYGRAAAIDPTWSPRARASVEPHRPPSSTAMATLAPAGGIGVALSGTRQMTVAHAVCLGRSGDVAGAIAVLEAVVARGERADELWLRLGEAYLAAGRLDDAASALAEAEPSSGRRDPEAAWLLAVAHDRARRTSLAEAAARVAQQQDDGAPNATALNRPPPITAGEREYILGLAALTPPSREPPEPARTERALAYFRRYLELAPATSPWRVRATEHLQAMASLDLASRLTILGGGLGDRTVVERVVRARMPAMRACLAALPSTLIELRITSLGPEAGPPRSPASPAPPPARGPTVRPPCPPLPSRAPGIRMRDLDPSRPPDSQQPGVSAAPVITFARPTSVTVDDAVACVEKIGAGLVLPRPPPGSWATLRIPVAAP